MRRSHDDSHSTAAVSNNGIFCPPLAHSVDLSLLAIEAGYGSSDYQTSVVHHQ